MAFESQGSLRRPLPLLCEAAGSAPFGTMVGWHTPAGAVYGVVAGKSGNELLVLTTYDKTMQKDAGLRFYRDEAMSSKLPPLTPTVFMDLQRVPAAKAFKHGRIRGAALQPYTMAAATLQLEGEETMLSLSEKMWIQGAVKKPGRLPKLLGLKQADYDALSNAEKIKKIDAALAELEGQSGKAAKSKRSALVLGKRFIGGIGRKKTSEEVDFAGINAKLEGIRQSLVEDAAESAFKQELRTWAVNEFEGFMKDLDKKMLAIKKGQWPTHGMEYAVTRYRPNKMTQEEFIDEVMDHYLAWRSNVKHAAKNE